MIYGNMLRCNTVPSCCIEMEDIFANSNNPFQNILEAVENNNVLMESYVTEDTLLEHIRMIHEASIKDFFASIKEAIKKFKNWLVTTIQNLINKLFKKAKDDSNQKKEAEKKDSGPSSPRRIEMKADMDAKKKEAMAKFFDDEDTMIVDVGYTLELFDERGIIGLCKEDILTPMINNMKNLDSDAQEQLIIGKAMKALNPKIVSFAMSKSDQFTKENAPESAGQAFALIKQYGEEALKYCGIRFVSGSNYSESKMKEVEDIMSTSGSFEKICRSYENIRKAAKEFADRVEKDIDELYNKAMKEVQTKIDSNADGSAERSQGETSKDLLSQFYKFVKGNMNTYTKIIGVGLTAEQANYGNIIRLERLCYFR